MRSAYYKFNTKRKLLNVHECNSRFILSLLRFRYYRLFTLITTFDKNIFPLNSQITSRIYNSIPVYVNIQDIYVTTIITQVMILTKNVSNKRR